MTVITPLTLVTLPLKVPWNRSWLLAFQTSKLPPVKLKHPLPQDTSAPVVTVAWPLVGTKLRSSNCELTVYVEFTASEPEVLAVVPMEPPRVKSMLLAIAAVGSAIANSTNKTTRLIRCSSAFFKKTVGVLHSQSVGIFNGLCECQSPT